MPTDLAFLQYPPQSVPPLDSGVGALFTRAWYMVFGQIQSNFAEIVRRLDAIIASVPAKMVNSLQADLLSIRGSLVEGQLVSVTDFGHVLQWDGSSYQWGPGELGSAYMQFFEVDPTSTGWHLYDGTANVPYLKGDGTTGTKTLPDLVSIPANGAYIKAGSPDSGPNAATSPTFTGGSIGSSTTGVNTVASASSVNVSPAGATLVSLSTHTHGINDPGHTHTLGSSTVGNDGEPRNLVRRPWFRQ